MPSLTQAERVTQSAASLARTRPPSWRALVGVANTTDGSLGAASRHSGWKPTTCIHTVEAAKQPSRMGKPCAGVTIWPRQRASRSTGSLAELSAVVRRTSRLERQGQSPGNRRDVGKHAILLQTLIVSQRRTAPTEGASHRRDWATALEGSRRPPSNGGDASVVSTARLTRS